MGERVGGGGWTFEARDVPSASSTRAMSFWIACSFKASSSDTSTSPRGFFSTSAPGDARFTPLLLMAVVVGSVMGKFLASRARLLRSRGIRRSCHAPSSNSAVA